MNNKTKILILSTRERIKEKKGLLASFISIFVGLISGSCLFNSPDFSAKNKLLSLFISFSTEITDKTQIEIFSGFLLCGLLYFAVMFFCGGNIFGKELSLFATAVKASGISVLVAFLYNQYGIEGFEYTLLVFIPGKCALILAMLLITECCFNTSGKLRSGVSNADAKALIKVFSLRSAVALAMMFFSVLIDFLCLIGFSKLINFIQN